MKAIKTSIALTLSILLLLPLSACKKGMADKDGNMWEYSLSEAKDREGYFVRVDKDGNTVYQPLLEVKDAGYTSLTGKTGRFILMCNRDKLIPIITGNNLLVYIDDDAKIPESFTLERFDDAGYTFGGLFSSSDKENGLRIKDSSIENSSMKAEWSKKSNKGLYILDNLGGISIGSKSIDNNGVFQGLEPGKKYEFSCFVGTKYETVTVMADTHYYKSDKIYKIAQKDCLTLTKNGFAIITIPKIESGYYLLNNTYMFYFDAENVTGTPIAERYEFVDTTIPTTEATETPTSTLSSNLIGNDDEDYELPGDSAPTTAAPNESE